MTSTRLFGHALRAEGKPCKRTYRRRTPPSSYDILPGHIGPALCECGEKSPVLESDGERKRWHRQHKEQVCGGLEMVGWPAWTFRPPWGAAVMLGKPVETRGKPVTYRGPVWLHHGQRNRWDPAGGTSPLFRAVWAKYARSQPAAHNSIAPVRQTNPFIPCGAVIGVVEITGCHQAEDPWAALCDPWAARDQWHITLARVRPLARPVPCRGYPGLGRWLPASVEAECRHDPHG